MTCECGGRMTSAKEDFDYSEGSGLPVVLSGIEVRRCRSCGEVQPVIPAIAKLHRAIAEKIIGKQKRLTPSEIRFLRKHLGWSGVDFAQHIGVAAETVSRWENGRDQMGPAADRALRLMVAINEPVAEYPTPPLEAMAQIGSEVGPVKLKAMASHGSWTAVEAS